MLACRTPPAEPSAEICRLMCVLASNRGALFLELSKLPDAELLACELARSAPGFLGLQGQRQPWTAAVARDLVLEAAESLPVGL